MSYIGEARLPLAPQEAYGSECTCRGIPRYSLIPWFGRKDAFLIPVSAFSVAFSLS